MLKNIEYKNTLIKIIVFQIVLFLIIFLVLNLEINKINQKIVEQNTALVGRILKNNPELEGDIIDLITKEITNEDFNNGEKILKGYGYDKNMGKSLQPILKWITPKLEIKIAFIILLSLILLIILIRQEYKKIYRKIREVSYAAERVVEGDFSIVLKEEGEGDLNVLNHSFNQMADRLKNSIEILQREKTFLKDTLSDISHQLKTPLSSLIMLNDLMLQDENMEEEVQRDFLEKTSVQLDRMEWLIINLLKIARIEAGAIPFKKDKVKSMEVIEIALSTLNMNLVGKNQKVKIYGDLESSFYGDKNWTGEAIINIIKNSIEHSKDGGVIKIILEETPLFTSIIIKDYGEGIDKKDIPHVFERFYKVNSEVKPDSIGIGLNLSKLIVESQDGTISVKSEKGKKTEFIITFLNLTKM
jgi:hypothetical protein